MRTLSRRRGLRDGFSLIELLVVIAIIAVIVSFVIPALGKARDAAKKQSTRDLIDNLHKSVSSYTLSERRSPGYFTPREMGHPDNTNEGFTTLQNMLLDLSGGVAATGAPGAIQVGPINTPARRVAVNPQLIGSTTADKAGYYTPPAANFKRQDGVEGGTREGNVLHEQIPELVDAWGTPIIAWQLDPTAVGPIEVTADFARIDAAQPARFYWNSNSAFFRCDAVGTKRKNYVTDSLLSFSNPGRAGTVEGFLGNPSSPGPVPVNAPHTAYHPTAPRGGFVLHAAGQDGIHLGIRERGGKLAAPAAYTLFYAFNFMAGTTPGSYYNDEAGRPKSIDLANEFDDIVQSGD